MMEFAPLFLMLANYLLVLLQYQSSKVKFRTLTVLPYS